MEGQQEQLTSRIASIFHDASNEDIEKASAEEEVCSVCLDGFDRQDVESDNSNGSIVKKTRCGHLFHVNCLCEVVKRARLAGASKCPMCREPLDENGQLILLSEEYLISDDREHIDNQEYNYEEEEYDRWLDELHDEYNDMMEQQRHQDEDDEELARQEYEDAMEQQRLHDEDDEELARQEYEDAMELARQEYEDAMEQQRLQDEDDEELARQ
eukprot:scaffold5093_cov108-Skeletonema_dohrnii-CCMP3373.AAC.7